MSETLVEALVIWGIKFLSSFLDSWPFAASYLEESIASALTHFDTHQFLIPASDCQALSSSLSLDPLVSALQRVIVAVSAKCASGDELAHRLQMFAPKFGRISAGDLSSQVRALGNMLLTFIKATLQTLPPDDPRTSALKPFQEQFPDLSISNVHPVNDHLFLEDPLTNLGIKRSSSAAELQVVTPRVSKSRGLAGRVRTPQTGRQEAAGDAIYVFPEQIQTKPRPTSPTYPEFTTVDIFQRSRVFPSIEAFREYLKRDALMCDVTEKAGNVSSDGCISIDLFCTHEHKEEVNGFSFLHFAVNAKKPKWRCAWRARARLAADGRVALYEPVFVKDPRESAMTIVNRVVTDDQVDLRNAGFPVFVSRCGHTHTFDGSGCHTLPLGLTETVSQLLQTLQIPLMVKNELSRDARFVHFKAKINDCVGNLFRKKTAFRESATVEQFLRKMEIRHNCIGITLDNTLPSVENKPVYIAVHSAATDSVIIQTRGWALELLAKSPAFYTDATFGVFLRRNEKIIGITVQDAFGTPFLVAAAICSREDSFHYAALFSGVRRGLEVAKQNVGEHRITRVMLDGLNYGSKLVEEHFPEAVRCACSFHFDDAVDKHMKNSIHMTDEERAFVKRTLFDVRRAPCAYSVVASWRAAKEIMLGLFPGNERMLTLSQYLESSYLNPSKKDDFGWFHSFCPRKSADDPHGPLAGCTNNGIESFFHILKANLGHLPNNDRPQTTEDMQMFISALFDHYSHKEFRWTNNLLENEKVMFLAARGRLWIQNAHTTANLALPTEDALNFLQCRDSRLLVALADEEANLLMGERVEDIGSHRSKSPEEFEQAVSQLDGQRLLVTMSLAFIVRFHKDHPPGTKDSFAYAVCNCPLGCRTGCHHCLVVHQLMWSKRNARNDPLIDPNEHLKWPTQASVIAHFNLQVGSLVHPPMSSEESAFNLGEIVTATTVEGWLADTTPSRNLGIIQTKLENLRMPTTRTQDEPFDSQAWKAVSESDKSTLEVVGIRPRQGWVKGPKESKKKRKERMKTVGMSKYVDYIKQLQADVGLQTAAPLADALISRFGAWISVTN